MNVVMTASAEDQRFALARRHDFDPCRFLASLIFLKVFQGPNMMHLDVVTSPTILTDLGQQSLFQF